MSRAVRNQMGVTLIELLVVVLILSTILGVVGASLMSGIRVWDTARTFHDRQAPFAIGIDLMSRDIMNAMPSYAIPWEGAATEMTLPTLVPGAATGSESQPVATPRLGQVHYYLDSTRHELMRKIWTLPGAEPATGEQLISDVSLALFEYQGTSTKGGGAWSKSWKSETNQPAAVRVTLEVKQGENDPISYQRVIVPWVEQQP